MSLYSTLYMLLVAALMAETAIADDPKSGVKKVVLEGLERGHEYETSFDGKWENPNAHRWSTGGMAYRDECDTVMQLAQDVLKDGRQCISSHTMYDNLSPYTPRETVHSVRSIQVVRALNDGKVDKKNVDTFFHMASRMRHNIMKEFNRTGLYYHLTEIVCREPRVFESPEQCMTEGCLPFCVAGCPEACMESDPSLSKEECDQACTDSCRSQCSDECQDNKWLSHPVHADANPDDCDMLDNGACVRRLPNDITTHLYLNEDFEGGEFFFTESMEDHRPKKVVQPTCGRMLAYTSGYENPHGVRALTEGRRCLVTLWLTDDVRKAEELPLPEDSPFLEGRVHGPGRTQLPP